ncbi:tripartite motif-containing protein 10-like isoform X2 [Python bivittatus]|uniref:Tripartite motif-containing protein 10-like isoform X2 n=1 Tax=Python bivittatus TaxID=176946 RepID=A0A9F5JBE1_PYTBI|nr:tripartite motif-containing protein 10-like isoform X2 [Python bivittatus]
MATPEGGEEAALRALGEEATCPLCLDYFKHPMGLACGHNFCRDCLAQLGSAASCPQCRATVDPGSARPNQPLANVVCLVKRLQLLQEGTEEEEGSRQLCREHQQPLQSFCSTEKCLLCPACLGGHQSHALLSLPEAAQVYKGFLDALLGPLKKEGEKLLEQQQAEEQSRQECQEQFATEKQKVGLALESLLGLLQEMQPVWVGWLEEQEKKMEAERDGTLAKLSGEASRLQELIDGTERKCGRPDWEFLQDIGNTLGRCESYVVGHIERVSPKLQDRLKAILEKNGALRQMVENYKASLRTTLTPENLEHLLATEPPQKPALTKAYVCLDNRTAHPRFQSLHSRVIWADSYQDVPDGPERFNREFCVLGCEGFASGQHWWEVSVQGQENARVWGKVSWAVGVARESVHRKASFWLSPREGIWAVGDRTQAEEFALSAPAWQRLQLKKKLAKVRVQLDYEAGKVEFFDADIDHSIYTFSPCSFLGEKIRPFFYLGNARIALQLEALPSRSPNFW